MQEDGTKSIQRKTREWKTQPKKSRQVVLADNVAETDKVEILRDMNIQCDNFTEARNLDKTVVNKS